MSPGGQNLDGMPHGTGTGDPVGNIAAEALDLQARYRAKLNEMNRAQIEIENMLDNLDPVERVLARYRYIDCLTWEAVCVRVNYSWRQVHRIHGQILDKLAAAEMKTKGETPTA
jgi:DNA-directed RNA polymerase specialized sigma24 family protein